jgi:ubiquinone/menaquinone biosynthesis C-methylase UbiE
MEMLPKGLQAYSYTGQRPRRTEGTGMQTGDHNYYSARALEYERVYTKPERQAELRLLKEYLPGFFSGLSVLEIACGTGYWTPYIAALAQTVCAIDSSQETLDVAHLKKLDIDRVRFLLADAMNLPADLGVFDACFCGFWWSHIPRQRASAFIASLHRFLAPGAKVLLLDNRYVEGSSTPISRQSVEGDTYQLRRLADGSRFEVLKNFPNEDELRAHIGARAITVKYTALQYYWYLEYQVCE